ncbi:MAG: S8 family serine peptidase [Tepidisphaera sp.]
MHRNVQAHQGIAGSVRRSWFSAALVVAACAGSALASVQVQTDNIIAESNHRALAALDAQPTLEYDPGSVLVKFSTQGRGADRMISQAAALVGGEVVQRWTVVPGLVHLTVNSMSVEDAIRVLSAMPEVEYAEPDFYVRALVTPNDPSYGQLWGMNQTNDADIDAPQGWDIFTGNPNFVVAVIDTGIQRTHPDLAANTWVNPGEIAGNSIDDDGNGFVDDLYGWDFVNNDNNPTDDNGHGTHCAGTIGAVGNNGVGVVGVVWNTKLAACKFLSASGSGSISAALSSLQYCIGKGIKVSNNSWGGGGFSQSMANALTTAANVGHIFVAAAGNGGYNNDTSPSYPASYTNPNVIAVAATASNDTLASFSQFGATSVDVGAPGVNIYSTYPTNSYTTLSGTSMATPHVAGVVTAVYGQNPSWTYQQVRDRIYATVRPVAALNGRCVTGGMVNLQAALVNNNNPPTINLTAPATNLTVNAGTVISYAATANDLQDGNISANIRWTSNLQGQIGTGSSFSHSTLMVGTHTITASISDSIGSTATATRTVVVNSIIGSLPGAPSFPRCYRSGAGVNVIWNDNSAGEFGFQIERQQRVSGIWVSTTVVGTTAGNVASYFDVPPLTGQAWRYRVRAFNGTGFSAWTPYASFSN